MLDKRLHRCLLLLVFLLANASEQAVASALPDSEEGRRRSLATGSGMFCVAIQGADPAALRAGLSWACGPGHADCTAIQPGGPCYKQNDLQALASYAYNDYYQRSPKTSTSCYFNGTATTITTDPSSGQCVFAGSSMAGGGTPAASAPSGLSRSRRARVASATDRPSGAPRAAWSLSTARRASWPAPGGRSAPCCWRCRSSSSSDQTSSRCELN